MSQFTSFISLIIAFQFMVIGVNAQLARVSPSPELQHQLMSNRTMPEKYELLEFISPMKFDNDQEQVTIQISSEKSVTFQLKSYALMPPKLTKKYPLLKTFIGTNASGDQAFIDITSSGFHASLYIDNEFYYLDPVDAFDSQYLISYKVKDYPQEQNEGIDQSCGTKSEQQVSTLQNRDQRIILSRSSAAVSMREYIIAVATTFEYCQFHGGTIESAMAAIVTAINRVNAVYNVDLATRLVIHEDTDLLIFCDQNDPYTNGVTATLIDENPTVLRPRIPVTSYDIGHVLCTNAGGIAQIASVCDIVGKDRGVSCHPNPINDPYFIGILSHELGHQFGANHIFNGAIGSCSDNISGSTAYEPGSGTTIMSYAGICGNDNVSNFASPYYNGHSLNEINNHIVTGVGNTCAVITAVDNTTPEISIDMNNNLFIPVNTPFELIGSANDNENDALNYVWEQHDLGIQANLGAPVNGNGPLFRSFPPSINPNRIFPALNYLLNNTTTRSEVLPSVSRPLTFLYTVRDNNESGGGVSVQEFKFRSTDLAGPFIITSHNQTELLIGGQLITVEWDIANTDKSPVNCSFVDILYSTDGGQSFDGILANSVVNSGTVLVNVPNISSDLFRVKVKGSDNIFFDVNNRNLTVSEATVAGYTLNIEPYGMNVCAPDDITFMIATESIMSFNFPINLSLSGDIPAGVEATLVDEVLTPGQGTQIQVSLASSLPTQRIEFALVVMVDGYELISRPIVIDIQSTDFSEIAAIVPLDGQDGAGVSQIFEWIPSANAEFYKFELSSDVVFNNIIFQEENIIENQLDISTIELEGGTTYYWRIQPIGPCGSGDYTSTYAFNTSSYTCQSFTSQDVPLTVNSQIDTAISSLTISENFTIEDLNVKGLVGSHGNVGDLIFQLISPNETVVRLLSRRCNQLNAYNLNLDDDVLNIITCPMDIGRTYQSLQVLSAFDGEQTSGQWRLQMIDAQAGNSGILNGWGLEFCSLIPVTAPVLEINEDILINPLSIRNITNSELLASDLSAPEVDITYTIVNVPKYGDLEVSNVSFHEGETFTQADIDNGIISYRHLVDNDLNDQFKFSISNPAGGWQGGLTFNILLDEVVEVIDLAEDLGIKIYPNPTSEYLNISVPQDIDGSLNLNVTDLSGKRVINNYDIFTGEQQINMSHLINGTYYLHFSNDKIQGIAKLLKID